MRRRSTPPPSPLPRAPECIDLFAGLGGWTEGAEQAGARVLWAANHSPVACAWHGRNHPHTVHACQDLHQADFRDAPQHHVLLASPSCVGHTRARGTDRPHHDADRATAWAVVTCAEVHRPPVVLVENVPEFRDWVLYPAWKAAMHALGYSIDEVVIDAAAVGVPQNRVRLFLVCARSLAPLRIRIETEPEVSAANVLDFAAGNWQPIEREGRSPRTLARVARGRAELGPRFLLSYYGSTTTGRSLARPIGTLTTVDRWALIDGDRMRMLSTTEARDCMGFPPSTALPGHRDAMHLLGNAVCPPVARRIVEAVMRAA